MVTYINRVTSWEHPYMEYRGLSTDTKPTDAPVNAKFVELDTGVEYYYSGGEWNLAPTQDSGGSDGGSSSGTGAFLAEITTQDYEEFTLVTPPSEVFAAAQEGPVTAIVELSDSGVAQVVRMDLTFAIEDTVTEDHAMYLFCFNGSGVDSGHDLSIVFNGAVDDGVNTADIEPETSGGSNSISYNDLLDRPFYEETVADSIHYTIPKTDGTSYDYIFETTIEGETCPVYLYRVTTHPMIESELAGCYVWVYQSDGNGKDMVITETIQSATTAVDGKDSVVGRYFMPNDIPYVIVADDNGNDINIPNAFNAKSLDVGTYLVYVDTSAVTSETHIYAHGIHRDAQIVVHKLNEKFYDKGASKFVVTLTESNGTWSADKTIAEIAAADAANQVVIASGDFGQSQGEVPLNIASSEEGNEYALFSGVLITDKKVGVQIIGLVDGGADEWTVQTGFSELPTYSSSNNGQVLGVDDGDLAWVTPESGITSWNDLTDKPFYEEVTPGINLEMPDGASYVEANFAMTGAEPMTVQMKLYRAGGVYTPEQLVGATVTLDIGEADPETVVIEADSFLAIEQDGETVGYMAIDGGIHSFIVLADNTVFNTSLNVSGDTVTLTSDNIPTAGTYLVNFIMEEDEFTCISITKAATTEVHKLDSKFYDGGASSWNDLNDRPFYETVTAAGYNFEIDLDDPNYVSGYFDIGEEVPAKFYRVGDPLTAAQLENAIGSVNNGEEIETHVIESNYIEEITDNGDTVGLFVAGDMPYCLVINNANTTIDVDATNDRPFGCSGTFTQAGTYLFWLDLSSMGEGASAYSVSLVKESESTVTPLPDKYYKAPLNVTADLDLSNMSVSNVSATFAEILAAIQGGRTTTLWLQFNDGFNDVNVPLYPSMVTAPQINFDVTAPFNFGGSTNVYTLHVCIYSSDSVNSAFYLHDATAQ